MRGGPDCPNPNPATTGSILYAGRGCQVNNYNSVFNLTRRGREGWAVSGGRSPVDAALREIDAQGAGEALLAQVHDDVHQVIRFVVAFAEEGEGFASNDGGDEL